MRRQTVCSFMLAGVNLNDFGLEIPSPFSSLELGNSQVSSMTSWTLRCTVGGDSSRRINVAAFEALLYSAAQSAASYENASGIPVSFLFGWLDENGNVGDHLSYQGFTLQFKVSTNGLYMSYELTGYATLALQTSMPVLRIPEVSGIVQPSAVLEALAIACKATYYYELDIDHNDAPTYVNHNALTTSFNKYVRGTYDGRDNYSDFPGLLRLSKSWNGSRDAAGLMPGIKKLSQLTNNLTITPISNYLVKSFTDETPQCSSFSYWVDEPTMTQPGCIHYKSNAGLLTSQVSDVLEYGTANTNILSLSGSYNGVAYNMTDMNFKSVGFAVDGSGNSIANATEVVNSWSSSLADVFQTANIINDVNALASQFSGDFTITIPGSTREYTVAQPISLLVMNGNTLSPVSGIYSIIEVTHNISVEFTTTLKVQRLVMSSANQVAAGQNIYVSGSGSYPSNSYQTTSNIITPYKVEFGEIFPDFTHIQTI
mgnify:CR=1 FL=1